MLIRSLRLYPAPVCKNLPVLWQIAAGIHNPRKSNLNVRFSSTGAGNESEKVYQGSLTGRMKAVKVFSLTTSIAGLAAQPIVIEQASNMGGTPMIVLMSGFVGFFTFVTPLLLHFITKKYVTAMQFNARSEEYTATTISFFLTPIYTKFRIPDVKVPDVPGLFTTFLIGKRALFVDPKEFSDTKHYIKIMGFDKPIDFKLELIENPKDDARDKKAEKTP